MRDVFRTKRAAAACRSVLAKMPPRLLERLEQSFTIPTARMCTLDLQSPTDPQPSTKLLSPSDSLGTKNLWIKTLQGRAGSALCSGVAERTLGVFLSRARDDLSCALAAESDAACTPHTHNSRPVPAGTKRAREDCTRVEWPPLFGGDPAL